MTHTDSTHPMVPAECAAGYAKVARDNAGVMELARKVDGYAHDMEMLQWSGDAAAAAGAARMLRQAMLLLAASDVLSARQLARKRRALLPERLAASGLGEMGVAMVRAALASDRAAEERIDSARSAEADGGLEPGALAFYADYGRASSFEEAMSQHVGLMHDHAFLVARGQASKAKRLEMQMALDLLRPASRPTRSLQEGGVKLALIQALGTQAPLLAAMLGAAARLEQAKWGFGMQRFVCNTPKTTFPGEAERCKAYEAAPDPTCAGPFIERAEAHWRDLEALGPLDSPARRSCRLAVIDLGLMAAAIPARNRQEAERKLEFLGDLVHLLGADQPLALAMSKAALSFECERWGITLLDAAERSPGTRH